MSVELYGYYNDELTSWRRKLEHQKEESNDLILRISVFAEGTYIDSTQCDLYLDQLMANERKFENLREEITSQAQRYARITLLAQARPEQSFCELQDLLRTRMETVEKGFTKTKYACAAFLSSFLVNPVRRSEKMSQVVALKIGKK